MPDRRPAPFASVRQGDVVTAALHLAGLTTREEFTVLANRRGVIYLDNGEGNDPSTFDHDGYHLVGKDRDPSWRLENPA